MAFTTLQVSAGGDDGYTYGSSFYGANQNVSFGKESSIMHAFFRFLNGSPLSGDSIPQGVTILSAILQLKSNSSWSSGSCALNVHFENADNPSAPTTAGDLGGRSLTSAVGWNPGTWSTDTWYDSPELKTILQAVVNRAGFGTSSAVIAYAKDNSSPDNNYRACRAYEHAAANGAKLVVEWQETTGEVSDSSGSGDSVDAYSLTDSISDQSGLSDNVEGYDYKGVIDDAVGVGDTVEAVPEREGAASDAAGIGDSVDTSAEIESDGDDAAGIGDAADGFNWSEWLRSNRALAITRFYLTITGGADGTTDIELPMSSFQARKRTANPTYVSVVIPFSLAAVDALEARANGEIVVEMAYLLDGVESVREEILRADLEQINPQESPGSRSIMLIGHKTITYANQETELSDPIYKYQSDGRLGYRFATPDPYLNPGDTAIVGAEEFTVESVVYMVSAGSGQTVMEVQE